MRFLAFALCLGVLLWSPTWAQPVTSNVDSGREDLAASVLLSRARDRQHTGAFSATVLCVRESFLRDADTLRGQWESGRIAGERRLTVSGPTDAFEWWSRAHGGEQWRREGTPGHLRRLPPHSRKKPALSPDVSYEDLARLPFGYLEGHRGLRRVAETDSTITLSLIPGGPLAALYSSLDVTLGRGDALVRRVLFTGYGGRPSKTLVVSRYLATAQGMFPTALVYSSADGLSATSISFALTGEETARDKAHATGQGLIDPTPRFAEPHWVPRDRTPEGD
jgi:hypothetical protein